MEAQRCNFADKDDVKFGFQCAVAQRRNLLSINLPLIQSCSATHVTCAKQVSERSAKNQICEIIFKINL